MPKLKKCPLTLPVKKGEENIYNNEQWACDTYAPSGEHLAIEIKIQDIVSREKVDEMYDYLKNVLKGFDRIHDAGLINMEKLTGHHYNARETHDDDNKKLDTQFRIWNYQEKDDAS